MHVGYFGINMGALGDVDAIARVARCAEDAGYESVWTGEHVVLVDPQVPPSPIRPDAPIVDTVVTLGFLAGVTERVRLGSGIILLPGTHRTYGCTIGLSHQLESTTKREYR